MDLGLKGKVALVTGASKGIGRAIAETLAGEGMRVALAARSADLLSDVAKGCGTESLVHATDLRDPKAGQGFVDAALARFGQIDLVVNNAGATKRGDFLALTDEDWADGFALKFFGAMRLVRAAWPHLVKSQGSIVNIIGIGGRTGMAEFAIGGSVNAAALNFTKVMADRGVKDGVRVNAINPGAIATERLKTRINALVKANGISEVEAAKVMAQELNIARFGEPVEIARMVATMASPLSGAYMQGAIIDIDGGATRTL